MTTPTSPQAQAQAIAETFVTQYYQTFDTNRSALASLYRPESVLTFEGQMCTGVDLILKKLLVIQHVVTTIDGSLTVDGGLLVSVVGQLKTDNDPPHAFFQSFYLKQLGDSLFVFNDIFRLGLHHQ